MRTLSRFIPGEEIEAVSQWSFGAVDADGLLLAARARDAQEAQDRSRADAARLEGHAQGYAEGFAQGRAHALVEAGQKLREFAEGPGKATSERFARMVAQVEDQLAASQQVMAQGVLELSCVLARQVLRHELSVNPNVLQPVIREALSILSMDNKSATVRLHPLDMEMLQGALQTEFAGLSLAVVADAAIQPGGCIIMSAGTVIDGTLDTRWRRSVASLGLNLPWDQ